MFFGEEEFCSVCGRRQDETDGEPLPEEIQRRTNPSGLFAGFVPGEAGPLHVDDSAVAISGVTVEDVATELGRLRIGGELDQDFIPAFLEGNAAEETGYRTAPRRGTQRAARLRGKDLVVVEPNLGRDG